jgi:hypothetical protein
MEAIVQLKPTQKDPGYAAAIVIPIGPGRETALDTLDSVNHYCKESHAVILVDDHTSDGTYAALLSKKQPNWFILRNSKPMGREGLVVGLAEAYRFVLQQLSCPLILRLDQDALVIKAGVISDALTYSRLHRDVGLFGVYECDYNRPRTYETHRERIDRETCWYRKILGQQPSWSRLLKLAEDLGYRRGDNVFGGAYFLTRECLERMQKLGALDVPYHWKSRLMEDVYFSMAAVASGMKLGHFAAPDGPLCLDWRGLPHPAAQLAQSHFKIIHSVDRGHNTGREENNNATVREIFASIRRQEQCSLQ